MSWSPKIHYHVDKIPPTTSVLKKINPAHAIPSRSFRIYFNMTPPSTPRSSKWSFLEISQTKLCMLFFSPTLIRDNTPPTSPFLTLSPRQYVVRRHSIKLPILNTWVTSTSSATYSRTPVFIFLANKQEHIGSWNEW